MFSDLPVLQASVHLAATPGSTVATKLHWLLSRSKKLPDTRGERIPHILHHVYLAGAALLSHVNCSAAAGKLLHALQQ